MIHLRPKHDADIAYELAPAAFYRPARDAIALEGRAVAIELGVAFGR